MAAEPMTIDYQMFNRLCRAHAELQDDFTAMLRCLENTSTLSKASLHREKFSAMLKRHPLADGGPPPTLADVLEPQLLGREVLRSCGGLELLALKEACSATCQCATAMQTGRLYAFGGSIDLSHGAPMNTVECFDLCTGKWESMPSMKIGRLGSVAGVIGGHVYVCGGVGELARMVEKFNLRLQKWEWCAPFPRLSVQRAYAAAAVVSGRLYICGGEDMDAVIVHSSVECFDPQLANGKGGTEVLPAQMLAPRRDSAAVVLPGMSYVAVCGGMPCATSVSVDGVRPHATCEMLGVIHTGSSWQEVAPMTRTRTNHSAVCVRGSIYVCGGFSVGPDPDSTVERFDLEQGCWNAMPPMLSVRGSHGAAALADRLYVVGGAGSDGQGLPALKSAECCGLDGGKWEWIPQMLQARTFFPMVAVKPGGCFK